MRTALHTRILICALVTVALGAAPVLAQPKTTRVLPPPPAKGATPPPGAPTVPAGGAPAPATPIQPPANPPPPPAAPAAPPAAPEPSFPGEKEATDCKKYPSGKKFKWELRGEVDLMTMLNTISPMLCRPFIVPSNIPSRKVTILAPSTI